MLASCARELDGGKKTRFFVFSPLYGGPGKKAENTKNDVPPFDSNSGRDAAGETRLDGLRAVFTGSWPGAIHQGNGTFQVIIDERADEAQREALRTIFYGEETEPGATVFNVFMSMTTTVHDPLYKKIDFEVDIDKRTSKLLVEGLVEGLGEPIRNPVTGVEHRSRIVRESSFEFLSAEMGSGTSKSMGAVPMELTSSYGQFANIHLSPHGIVQ